MMRWLGLIVLLGVAGLAWAQPAGQVAATEVREFNIPPQSLETALRQLAATNNLQVLYDPKDVRGMHTTGVKGQMPTRQAVEKLIEGSGLEASFGEKGAVVLKPQSSKSTTQTGGPAQNPTQLAQAQSAERREAGSGRNPVQLEAITVTATKREERLQDVPISVGVVTRDDIDRRGSVNAGDYLRGMPGVNQMEGAGGQSIVIRGLESNTHFQGFRGGETTGTYFGETPTTGSGGLAGASVDIKLVDIERVEVLRGPQGTAFGSSSMGGTVRVIPVAPRLDRFEGKASGGYSVTAEYGGDNYDAQGVINIPLAWDRLAVRAVAYRYRESGFFRSTAGSNPAFLAIASQLGAQRFATDGDDVGAYSVSGARLSALFRATDALRLTLSYLTQRNETNGLALATSGPYEQSLFEVAPEHARRGQARGLTDSKIEIANAVLEYDAGWADLLATYSDLRAKATLIRPQNSLGVNWAFSVSYESPHDSRSGELRLASKLAGALNFLAGVYAERTDTDFLQSGIWFGDLSRSLFPAGGRFLLDSLDQRELKQHAAFGELSWQATPNIKATAGIRGFEYERSIRTDATGFLVGGTPPPQLGQSEASGSVHRVNLSFKPSEDSLLYAAWSQGFRPGGPQSGLPDSCDLEGNGLVTGTNVTVASTRKIDSDKIDNFEIGGKLALLGRRLTLDFDVFRMNWSDMPVSRALLTATSPACRFGVSVNGGKIRSDGIEFQMNFQATRSLRIDLGASYMDSRLVEDVPAQGFRAGNRPPGAPKVNANLGVQQNLEVAGRQAFVRLDGAYIGSFYGDLLNSPITKTDSYIKFDLTGRVFVNPKFHLDLYVHNLTNRDDFTYRGAYSFPTGNFFGYQMRPRTIGARFSHAF